MNLAGALQLATKSMSSSNRNVMMSIKQGGMELGDNVSDFKITRPIADSTGTDFYIIGQDAGSNAVTGGDLILD
jgi:hypothetical protein